MRQLLLQITIWEVEGARNGKTVQGSFFIIYEKVDF